MGGPSDVTNKPATSQASLDQIREQAAPASLDPQKVGTAVGKLDAPAQAALMQQISQSGPAPSDAQQAKLLGQAGVQTGVIGEKLAQNKALSTEQQNHLHQAFDELKRGIDTGSHQEGWQVNANLGASQAGATNKKDGSPTS